MYVESQFGFPVYVAFASNNPSGAPANSREGQAETPTKGEHGKEGFINHQAHCGRAGPLARSVGHG